MKTLKKLTLCALASVASLAGSNVTEASENIKVGTYNIYSEWNARPTVGHYGTNWFRNWNMWSPAGYRYTSQRHFRAKYIVDRAAPDILNLQEIRWYTVDDFFPYTASDRYALGAIIYRGDAEGIATMYNRSKYYPLAVGYFQTGSLANGLPRYASWLKLRERRPNPVDGRQRSFFVVNCHLDRDYFRRQEGRRALHRWMNIVNPNGRDITFLSGDFNAQHGELWDFRSGASNWTSRFWLPGTSGLSNHNWDGYQATHLGTLAIDHNMVYTANSRRSANTQIHGDGFTGYAYTPSTPTGKRMYGFASDHYLVTSDFRNW